MTTWNLHQVLEAELTDDVNVLVMTGGAKTWKTESEYLEGAQSVSANQENQLWICSGRNADNAVNGHGRMTLLTDMPSEIERALMSDPQTLLGFINYAAQRYPAQMVDLILWDHGGGPALGFGMDNRVEEDDTMSVGAIAKCLKQSAVDRFDIVNFDACLMSSVEVAATLYGQGHDISAAIQAAREASAAGNVTASIEAAQITVSDAVFNRRLQMPEVTVKIGDRELVQDEDYELVVEEMLKAGTQELKLFGRGDYVGYTTATFTMLPAESTVEALEAVALGDLANGEVTVLTVDTPAHPDNVQFDFSGTDESLRQYLKEGADGKTVVLDKGAVAGAYEIRVDVIDGGEDTYANIDGEIHAIEVK